jgi:hypothetical protein
VQKKAQNKDRIVTRDKRNAKKKGTKMCDRIRMGEGISVTHPIR